MLELNPETEAGQIAALAKEALTQAPTIIFTPDGKQFAAVPTGYDLRDITPAGAAKTYKPDHIATTVRLNTASSLSDYLARFKTDSTLLFADITDNSIVGAIDYHGPGAPDLVKHKAILTLPYSNEWKIWDGIDGKLMSQLDFARFLEENAQDIASPVAADLLECVRDMQAVEKADFRAQVRTDSDNVDFTFQQQTEMGTKSGLIEVPKRFLLALPVFFGSQPVTLDARLRWRKTQDGLQLGIMILRKEQVRQDQFQDTVSEVSANADVPALYGKLT